LCTLKLIQRSHWSLVKPHFSGLTEMILLPPQMFDVPMFGTIGEECSLTLSRVRRAGKPAEMFRTGGGVKLL
jgi:hypothetical protein